MSRLSELPPPSEKAPTRGFRAGIGFAIERVPFRQKLNLLVVVPVVVISILFAVVATGEVQTASSAGRQADLFRASEQVAALADDIQAEHQQANVLAARHDLLGVGVNLPGTDGKAYQQSAQATKAQAAAVRSAFGDSLPAAEAAALLQVDSLDQVRSQIAAGQLSANNIDSGYALAVDGLVDGLGLAGSRSGNQALNQQLDALMRADSAHSTFETSLLSAQTTGDNAMLEFLSAVGAQDQYTSQRDRFSQLVGPDRASQLNGIDYNADEKFLDDQFAALEVDPSTLTAQSSPATMLRAWTEDVQPTADHIVGESATRLAITRAQTEQIAATADSTSNSAWWHAGLLMLLTLLISIIWVTLSVLIRHSVVRPVQRLTAAARKVAAVSEAELSRVADDDDTDESPARLEALPVLARDELGSLAEAFNQVQLTAAGLLERQVTSRRNIAEMFGNIGRRVSNLTTRQLALIDAVERGETDPELLEQLYRIDHIAVRMQRNADSLMLLAGIRESELDGRPAAVTHVLRAALGQIEGYQRVTLRTQTDATVAPDIVGDLVLMLAELLENAASFSPAHSNVEVTVRSAAGGQAAIEIVDHGLGMGSDRLAEENARLVRRERLDLVPTKVLGLFVVGTLARRWGVAVTLSRTPGGGVTSLVTVPAELLAAPVAAPSAAPLAPPTALTTPAPVPAQAPAYPQAQGQAQVAAPGGTAPAPRTAVGSAPVSVQLPPAAEGGLPRRAPRRPADEPVHAHAPEPQAAAEPARPEGLRRRVRGATLSPPNQAPRVDVLPSAPLPEQDAEEVRSSLEEFEAAVSRAERDSTLTGLHVVDVRGNETRSTEHSASQELPEGVGP